MRASIQFIKNLTKHRLAFLSLLFLLSLHVIGIGVSINPDLLNDPTRIDITQRLQPPEMGNYLLGTDAMGRDVFSRIIFGIRVTLFIGFTSMVISLLLGVSLGTLAGYYGGIIDILIMRCIDILASFPRFCLIVVIVAVSKPTVLALTITIGFTGWISVALLIRNKILSLKQREFVCAVEALGGGSGRIIFKHLLPNCLPNLIVALTYGIGNSILLECSLSYLTIGVQEPLPSLGNMLFAGKKYLLQGRYIWLSMLSGFAIMFITMSYSFLGDGLSAVMNPHIRKSSWKKDSILKKIKKLFFKGERDQNSSVQKTVPISLLTKDIRSK